MPDRLARLKKIGFTEAGVWKLTEKGVFFELNELATSSNVLYAFIVDDDLMYIGKTVMPLAHRMQRYKTPASNAKSGGSTNIKNNKNIRSSLELGKAVQIFALPDNGLLHYGGFHVNLAAGLEDSLVKELAPPWNGGKKESPQQTLEPIIADGCDEGILAE